jgi:hypothetical protein
VKAWTHAAEEFVRTWAYDAGRIVGAAACESETRRSVSWSLDLFWLGVAEELEARGVSRRVAADMFGVSRRTYLRTLSQIRETLEFTGTTMWSSIHRSVTKKPDSRDNIIARFPSVEPRELGAIIHDMLEHGWLVDEGKVINAVPKDELDLSDDDLRRVIKAELLIRGELDIELISEITGADEGRIQSLVEEAEAQMRVDEFVPDHGRFGMLTMLGIATTDFIIRAVALDPREEDECGVWTHPTKNETQPQIRKRVAEITRNSHKVRSKR